VRKRLAAFMKVCVDKSVELKGPEKPLLLSRCLERISHNSALGLALSDVRNYAMESKVLIMDIKETVTMLPTPSEPSGRKDEPFWLAKSLNDMTQGEWESLCDGCGRCCLNKLEDYDTGEISWTNIACRLLDQESCRCRDYANRHDEVADCLPLTLASVKTMTWLPPTCAYRLVAEKKQLYWWHYLVSGDRETVHQAGVSVRGRTISEAGLTVEDFERYIVTWPGEEPH
jgi:uncharacterized cysteine cluster protein YcgN (CxxCxxCC family)